MVTRYTNIHTITQVLKRRDGGGGVCGGCGGGGWGGSTERVRERDRKIKWSMWSAPLSVRMWSDWSAGLKSGWSVWWFDILNSGLRPCARTSELSGHSGVLSAVVIFWQSLWKVKRPEFNLEKATFIIFWQMFEIIIILSLFTVWS